MTGTPAAIVCDLDGTLLDTLEDLADSVNIVLAEQGLPVHAVQAYRYFVGDGASVLMTRVLPEKLRDTGLHTTCLKRFREVYATRWNLKTKPYRGIPEMLAEVSRRAIRLAVLSNKPHDVTLQCVDVLLASTVFDIVQGQVEGVPRKPDPQGALAIAQALHVAPERCWYLGDTATDMQTATRAGMLPVGVLWGFRTREELAQHGARVLLASPDQLLPLLDGGGAA
jgi:phosphoglycolate phosphatase